MPVRNQTRRRMLMGAGALTLTGPASWLLLQQPQSAVAASTRPTQATASVAPAGSSDPAERRALFGDLHLHTAYSFDAFTFKTTATPDDAYAFAQGGSLAHPAGGTYKLERPLDFLAVTDHSEFMGVVRAMGDPSSPLSKLPIASRVLSTDPKIASAAFYELVGVLRGGGGAEVFGPGAQDAITDAWQRQKDAANRAYKPGRFTTFIGYEWTGTSEGRNLHRNVIFRTADAPLPLSATPSSDPENLWRYLDSVRAKGYPVLAIPHNSNASDGVMFGTKTFTGKPFTRAYADARARNEPLVEVTQVKGTSETHSSLSPNDEFADFEILPSYIASAKKLTRFAGGYVRDALATGLVMQDGEGFNPYNFGMIGSTDSHTGISPIQESNYSGKVGVLDGTAKARYDCTYCRGSDYRNFSAAGVAGVWASANTREAIFDALARKETYATTGPRMQVRFFAGPSFAKVRPGTRGWVRQAYAGGVPMGGTVRGGGRSPVFLVSALKDPDGINLDRVQIVKVWAKAGRSHEKIFDVALSGGRRIDKRTGKAPPVGDSIDYKTLKVANTIGSATLSVRWSDPDFDPTARAAYYVRVLEIPSPRWSTYDAMRLRRPVLKGWHATIQERAYTSPIWYDPGKPARS